MHTNRAGYRKTVAGVVLLVLSVIGLGVTAPRPLHAQQLARSEAAAPSPERRMEAFLAAVMRKKPDSIAAFFPLTGTFSFTRTTHQRDGSRTGVWRFPGANALAAISAGGPLHRAFTLNPHGHPVGPFFHQVVLREGRWRRIGGNRFVPPDAPASSPIFVEWRREGDTWVVAAFGDEIYGAGVPIPAWCC